MAAGVGRPSRDRLALLCGVLLLVHLSASGGQVFASFVLEEGANTLVFATLMVSLAALLCALLASVTDAAGLRRAVFVAKARGHGLTIVLLGVNNAIKSVAFMMALWYVSALNAAIYIPLIPVFACVLARLLGWETLNWQQVAGVAVGISGALLVTVVKYASDVGSSGAVHILVGNGLLLLWDTTAAAAIVLQRPLLRQHTPITLTTLILAVAAVCLAVVVPCIETTASDWTLSHLAQGAVVYCAGYNVFMNWGDAWAVTMLPASLVAMWLTLEPAFTAALSAIFLDETMSGWEYAGAALTCSGLLIVLSAIEERQVADLPRIDADGIGKPPRPAGGAAAAAAEDAPLLHDRGV